MQVAIWPELYKFRNNNIWDKACTTKKMMAYFGGDEGMQHICQESLKKRLYEMRKRRIAAGEEVPPGCRAGMMRTALLSRQLKIDSADAAAVVQLPPSPPPCAPPPVPRRGDGALGCSKCRFSRAGCARCKARAR